LLQVRPSDDQDQQWRLALPSRRPASRNKRAGYLRCWRCGEFLRHSVQGASSYRALSNRMAACGACVESLITQGLFEGWRSGKTCHVSGMEKSLSKTSLLEGYRLPGFHTRARIKPHGRDPMSLVIYAGAESKKPCGGARWRKRSLRQISIPISLPESPNRALSAFSSLICSLAASPCRKILLRF
jgi:hypothetical protein